MNPLDTARPVSMPRAEVLFPSRSLYVHIPFCAGRCSYCDFFSVLARRFPHHDYIEALLAQLRAWTAELGAGPFDTIYIGGGTPSVLEPPILEYLLSGISEYAAPGCEWSIEANPESLSIQLLDAFAESGVTRLSLGVQTLVEDEWTVLGRVGSVAESLAALERARRYPLELSADLLAGIPTKSNVRSHPEYLKRSLEKLAPLVSHLSLYDLTVEEGTALEHRIRSGELSMPDEDELAELRLSADTFLEGQGFARYEVSNYARQGKECRHSAAYWNMEPYLGVGSGAVSTLHLRDPERPARLSSLLRLTGVRDIARYIADPSSVPPDPEAVDRHTALFEFLMMGFRTTRGVDTERVGALFGVELSEVLPETLARWQNELWWHGPRVSLYPRNFDILNRFLVECLEELS